MRWRIYYQGGTTYDSTDGSWAEAPSEGALVVASIVAGRVELHLGHDHYQLESDGSVVMRDARTLLANIGRREMSPVVFGLYVGATEMEAAVERARRDFGLVGAEPRACMYCGVQWRR